MLTCRCTAKVFKRLKTAPSLSPPLSTTRLGDWYINLLYWKPQVLFCVSERTLLPVIIPARDSGAFASRLVIGVGEVLRAIGISEAAVAEELNAMQAVTLAKTANRQVLGSMKDLIYGASFRVAEDPNIDLTRLALWLSDTPCGPLEMGCPFNVTRAVFGEPPLSYAESRSLIS